MVQHTKQTVFIVVLVFAILVGVIVYGGYKYSKITQAYEALQTDFELSQKNLADERATRDYVLSKLTEEQGKNSEFANQITDLLSTVGTLDKLSKTDKELLQKYSKVYFLNEHYVPDHLKEIPAEYINEKGKQVQLHASVWPYLEKMLVDAKAAGHPLSIISGFRSFGDQSSLKASYKVTYGSGANAFSADQGYSEHQLGTTLDFTTPELGSSFTSFEKTEEYMWLLENAYKYGFILSYPKGNGYYTFEPWHWRFVGIKLATRLHNEGENFYDLDQRTIDNYLVTIFD